LYILEKAEVPEGSRAFRSISAVLIQFIFYCASREVIIAICCRN
jgi:hypothetical protein